MSHINPLAFVAEYLLSLLDHPEAITSIAALVAALTSLQAMNTAKTANTHAASSAEAAKRQAKSAEQAVNLHRQKAEAAQEELVREHTRQRHELAHRFTAWLAHQPENDNHVVLVLSNLTGFPVIDIKVRFSRGARVRGGQLKGHTFNVIPPGVWYSEFARDHDRNSIPWSFPRPVTADSDYSPSQSKVYVDSVEYSDMTNTRWKRMHGVELVEVHTPKSPGTTQGPATAEL